MALADVLTAAGRKADEGQPGEDRPCLGRVHHEMTVGRPVNANPPVISDQAEVLMVYKA